LHVHVGLPSGEAGSASSPFWQGRDTGLASARTPLFQAFPRVGIPRAFGSYGEYVRAVNLLLECNAFPDHTYLWWDVRPQPRLGTVEIRIMDAQSTLRDTAALVALVQSIVRLELVDGHADAALVHAPEVLDENRFLAARDGVGAQFVDPVLGRAVSVNDITAGLLVSCAPHAEALGCAEELKLVAELLVDGGPSRQRRLAEQHGLVGLVSDLAADFRDGITRAERDSVA